MRELLQPPIGYLSFALLALLLSVAFIVVQTVWIEATSMFPERAPIGSVDPELHGLELRDATLQTADGLTLRGWFVPSRNGAAVALVHGYAGNRHQLVRDAALLARAGYGVLLFDSRAHGQSDGDKTTFGDRERADVRAAVDFLSQHVQRIALLGFSAGASAVAMASAADPRVGAVVLLAPPSTLREFTDDEAGRLAFLRAPVAVATMRVFGVDVDAVQPVRAVARLARPLLVVHGEADHVIPVARGRAVYGAAQEPKSWLLVRGAAHGDFLAADGSAYGETLLAFLDGQLRSQPIHGGR
jgi:uncharacterized protein